MILVREDKLVQAIFFILIHFNIFFQDLNCGQFQVDWDGYTIGYYGRIFEARNKTKGGSFEV